MTFVDRWLLPDGVDELLPPQARNLENVRRFVLDRFSRWGYDYVIPPTIEFLESLLTGTGRDLDIKTFKITDQISGRMMGVRADITPQVARIDAHSLGQNGITRLCYSGTVLHTRPDHMLATRTPIRAGAELFGDTSEAGDLEISSLMLDTLTGLGDSRLHLELGDVSIFRHLMKDVEIDDVAQARIFDLVQHKSADLPGTLAGLSISDRIRHAISILPGLTGGESVLERARAEYAGEIEIQSHLSNLETLSLALKQRFPDVQIHFDLSELRGFEYHTGLVFAAYNSGGQLLGKGGRYDRIGEVFGRARGATGFDLDVKTLASIYEVPSDNQGRVLLEHSSADEHGAWLAAKAYREKGYTVIDSGELDEGTSSGCDYVLRLQDGTWGLFSVS